MQKQMLMWPGKNDPVARSTTPLWPNRILFIFLRILHVNSQEGIFSFRTILDGICKYFGPTSFLPIFDLKQILIWMKNTQNIQGYHIAIS